MKGVDKAAEPSAAAKEDAGKAGAGKAAKSDGARRKCAQCKKRLSVSSGLSCRCGGVYCTAHRYPEDHECTFDYRSLGFHHRARELPEEKREWVGQRGR